MIRTNSIKERILWKQFRFNSINCPYKYIYYVIPFFFYQAYIYIYILLFFVNFSLQKEQYYIILFHYVEINHHNKIAYIVLRKLVKTHVRSRKNWLPIGWLMKKKKIMSGWNFDKMTKTTEIRHIFEFWKLSVLMHEEFQFDITFFIRFPLQPLQKCLRESHKRVL